MTFRGPSLQQASCPSAELPCGPSAANHCLFSLWACRQLAPCKTAINPVSTCSICQCSQCLDYRFLFIIVAEVTRLRPSRSWLPTTHSGLCSARTIGVIPKAHARRTLTVFPSIPSRLDNFHCLGADSSLDEVPGGQGRY